MEALDELKAAVDAASAELRGGDSTPNGKKRPSFERPPRADFGDYSTNAAMLLAGALKSKPRDVAEKLGEAVSQRLGDRVTKVDVAGPGFLNLFMADAWYAEALQSILAAERYGAVPASPARSVNVEFVSANPTGPMTAASGRHAAFGDAVARLLELRGHKVTREYYINDHGVQVRKLAESIRARARGEDVPEGGYEGDYVHELAQEIPGAADMPIEELTEKGVALMLERIRASMDAYRVHFDVWSSENALYEGKVDAALARLREAGQLYESEGAEWLRTTAYGDDKDRVTRKSDGEPTYFQSDIAYHLDKRERGSDVLIDVLGSDHHGYEPRLKAIFSAFALNPDDLEVLILQFVNIVEGGVARGMSKRRGEFVSLDELIEKIGVDAARFFMLQRSHDTMIDLDVDLAASESRDNPVYYVQMMHARIASIFARTEERGAATPPGTPLEDQEKSLIKSLVGFPELVAGAADHRAPHRVAAYALETARQFSVFYEKCPVLRADTDEQRAFRLALCEATRRVLATSLGLLGVSAPERM